MWSTSSTPGLRRPNGPRVGSAIAWSNSVSSFAIRKKLWRSFATSMGLRAVGPTVALNDQQLADLNSKLIAARTDAAEKKTRVDFLADVAAGKKTLDSLPDSLSIAIQRHGGRCAQKLADASQREADLLARYNSRHPAVVNVEAEKRDIERSIAAETQRMIKSCQKRLCAGEGAT